jgi:membrane-bound serine protease (ClpP class)
MKRFRSLACFVGIAWTLATSFASGASTPTVLLAEIRGTINPATAEYLERSIERAEKRGAQALVITLDTPGGLVSSVQKMAQAIDRSKTPVVVYVEPAGASATSAGALLMLASHLAVMTPGSHMGSAHPVDASGKDISGAMGEKVLNDTASFAEGLAEIRGRDKALVSAIVRKSRSFTAQEAMDAKLIDALADSTPDLLRKIEGKRVDFRGGGSVVLRTADARVESLEMSLGQKALNLLSNPNIAAILATIGLVLVYFEVNNPGMQVSGILGVICLVISFMSFQTLPIRTGGLVLLVVGAIGLIAEVFATTHGILGAAGVLSFFLGLIWVIDPEQIRFGVSPAVYVPASLFLGAMALLIGWFAARTRADAHAELERMKGGGESGLSGYTGVVQTIEVDSSGLMGKILIRGELWDFIADGAVAVGDSVEVSRSEGLKVFVKAKPGVRAGTGTKE